MRMRTGWKVQVPAAVHITETLTFVLVFVSAYKSSMSVYKYCMCACVCMCACLCVTFTPTALSLCVSQIRIVYSSATYDTGDTFSLSIFFLLKCVLVCFCSSGKWIVSPHIRKCHKGINVCLVKWKGAKKWDDIITEKIEWSSFDRFDLFTSICRR